jgi:integrase/recombinase XerD
VRLHEKGGKEHEAPRHHKLEAYLDEYITAAGIAGDKDGPLFRTMARATGITDYLKGDGSQAEARKMANHADTPTTQRYDRRADTASPGEYEKVGI